MKILFKLLFITILFGCRLRPDNGVINTAAIHFSGVFMTKNIISNPNLRVKGISNVKNEHDSIYVVSGTVKGYSPMNYPVSMEHFSETLRYLGGNPNLDSNWACIDIYISAIKNSINIYLYNYIIIIIQINN